MPVRPLRSRRLVCWLVMFGGLATWGTPGMTHAQSLLLGPTARRIKAKVELDPKLPAGYLRRERLALPIAAERACSPTLPLCVAAPKVGSGTPFLRPARASSSARSSQRSGAEASDAASDAAAKALFALETAYRRLVYAAALPMPLRSWDPAHGSPAVTWELVAAGAPLAVELIPHPQRPFSSASVVCRSGVADVDSGDWEREAMLCIGEAIAARLDAAESPRSRRAFAQALYWELGNPGATDILELSRANAAPHRALLGRDEVADAASTALFFEYLEGSLGTPKPFGLVTGLFTLSGQAGHPDLPRVVNEPDWLDVLRESLDDNRVDFAHRVNAFAAARMRLGAADGPLAGLAWAGNFARITPDWDLRVSTLPRRVANKHPVEPLGMVVVRINVDTATKDLSLAVRTEWEGPGPFTWTVVKLDEHDREIGRLDFAFEPRVTNAEKRIVALDGVRSLLVIGVNLGGIDATHLLDPDHAPFEPHGCTVYVARLQQ